MLTGNGIEDEASVSAYIREKRRYQNMRTINQKRASFDGMTILKEGALHLMGAPSLVEWPPKDANGKEIYIGDKVHGQSTLNLFDGHVFIVGALRLQIHNGELCWVICSYDDDDRYFESWANDTFVVESIAAYKTKER